MWYGLAAIVCIVLLVILVTNGDRHPFLRFKYDTGFATGALMILAVVLVGACAASSPDPCSDHAKGSSAYYACMDARADRFDPQDVR